MSTFNVLARLVELQSFAFSIGGRTLVLDRAHTRAQVEMLMASLQPAQVAKQLTAGDFYGTWTPPGYPRHWQRPSQCQRGSETCGARIFFCAALYMDPRYRLLLTTEQKSQARLHLAETWQRTVGLQRKQQDESINQAGAVTAVPDLLSTSVSKGKGSRGWCAP